MTGPAIRPATTADLPAIRRIVDAAYGHYIARIGKPPGPMLDDYAARVRQRQVWLAERDGRVAGLVVLVAEPDHLLLDNIAIDPAMQGLGLGGALLRFAEAQASSRGYREMRLYTHALMTENLAIYARLGWERTGTGQQSGYDRVYFRKPLLPNAPEPPISPA